MTRIHLECPVHFGAIHGDEAAELRAGIELLIPKMQGEHRSELIRLLDRVDARDSLAQEEAYDAMAATPMSGHDLAAQSDDWLLWYVRELSDARDRAFHGGLLTQHWALVARIADVEDQLAIRGARRARDAASRHTERELELARGLMVACEGWKRLVQTIATVTGQHLDDDLASISTLLDLSQGKESAATSREAVHR